MRRLTVTSSVPSLGLYRLAALPMLDDCLQSNVAADAAKPPRRHCGRLEPEHEQHRRRRGVLKLGHVPEYGGWLPCAHQHGDVLLAVDRVGDRRRIDAGA